jgi:YgiT-type zinc finger domain-containing protein
VGFAVSTKENAVKCVICKQGETQPGTVTVTLERDSLTLVVKGVPARICQNCGEEYLDEDAASRLLETAEEAARDKVFVDIRQYVAA